MITFSEFFNKGTNNNNCFCFYSKDQYNLDRAFKILEKDVLTPEFNSIKIKDSDVIKDKTLITSQCEVIPFMSNKRIVIISAENILNGGKGKEIQSFLKILCEYSSKIPPTTILILYSYQTDKRENLKKNSILSKLDKAGITVVTSAKSQKTEATALIKSFLLNNKLSLDKEIVQYLSEIDNLDFLNTQLDKLLFVEKNSLNIETVKSIISCYDDSDIFNFTDTIGTPSSIIIYNNLISEGNTPINILYMLIRQLRLLYYCKLYTKAGISYEDAAKKLNINPYVCKNLYNQALRFNLKVLEEKIQKCIEAEVKIKTQPLNAKLEVELILY